MFKRRRHLTETQAIASLLVVLVGCAGNAPATMTPDGLVPTYRGDPARTGRMPGPGPTANPAVAWSFEAEGRFANSPVVAAGVVYAVGGDGVIHALDLETGSERWSVDSGGEVAASPLISAGRLVVGDTTGNVKAFGLDDGAPGWSVTLDGAITGSPAVVNQDLIVATQAGHVYRLAGASGDVRWTVDAGATVVRSVAVDAESAYIGAADELVALALADGSQRWRVRLATGGDVGTPAVADGMVFAASGIGANDREDYGVVAVDASSGDVRWSYKSPEGAVIYTPAIGHGVAFVIGHDGLLVALDAATGEQRWSLDVHAELEALPAIVDDRVYIVGTGRHAAAVDAATGGLLWEVPIEGVPFAPAVVGGYLIVGTDIGMLYAIGGA